jgi:hypothetical protein
MQSNAWFETDVMTARPHAPAPAKGEDQGTPWTGKAAIRRTTAKRMRVQGDQARNLGRRRVPLERQDRRSMLP